MTESEQKHLQQVELRLAAYEQAINRIDDYFEYSHKSETDKKFVMDVINGLTNKLKSIFHK